MTKAKTAIVTGASQGIGAGVVAAFVERGYNVVATSRSITKSARLPRMTTWRWSTATLATRRRPPGSPKRPSTGSARLTP